MSNPLLLDQTDYFGLISSDEFFAIVRVLRENKGVTEADVDAALSTLLEAGGKIGTAVVVLMPVLTPDGTDGPTANYFNRICIQVIGQPLLADDETSGSGLTAEDLAHRIMQICHARTFGRSNEFMFDGMEPLAADPGKVSYGVFFKRLGRDALVPRVETPVIAEADGTVTLTCATAGAVIRYTLDGSAPFAANGEALVYSAPFEVEEDCTVRTAASFSAMQPSEVAQADIVINQSFEAENSAEVEATVADQVNGSSAKLLAEVDVGEPGTYLVRAFFQFAYAGYVQAGNDSGIELRCGDPDASPLDAALWSEPSTYPDPETSGPHGPGEIGMEIEVPTAGTRLALYVKASQMQAGSIVVAPGAAILYVRRA